LVVVCLCFTPGLILAQDNKTVLGPTNPHLHDGAEALMAGDAEEGVRKTLEGLQYASSQRDRVSGMSNVCAGYVMLGEPEKALAYCDQALEINDQHWRARSNRAFAHIKLGNFEEAEQDLQVAEAIAPHSRNVKVIRSMLLDATDPVAPLVIIDDRRQAGDDDKE
jgi:tetratricopeptide (TPR) repeat protein